MLGVEENPAFDLIGLESVSESRSVVSESQELRLLTDPLHHGAALPREFIACCAN